MREKLPLTNGIAGLVLVASIFLGCQDFLSQDKPEQPAAPSAEIDQGTAQGALTQETSDPEATDQQASAPIASTQAVVDTEPAKDLPLTAAEPPKPVTSEPTSTPASSGDAAECQAIYDQMQSAKDPLYGELKNRFGSLNCDFTKIVVPTVPFVPPDSATVCKNLRSTLAEIDPGSPKYASYLQEIAIYCADADSPTAPVSTSPTPGQTSAAETCKTIFAEMQSAKDPQYGELKNQYGLLNCSDILAAAGTTTTTTPPPQPDLATVCSNLKATLGMLEPDSPKYTFYLSEIETHCTGNP